MICLVYMSINKKKVQHDICLGHFVFSVIVTLVIVSALLFSWIYLLSLIIYLLSLIIYLLSLIVHLLSLIIYLLSLIKVLS